MDGGGDTWRRVGQRRAAVGATPWNFGADPARGQARRIPWLSSRRRDTASVYGSSRNDRDATPVGFTKKDADVVAFEETFDDGDDDDDDEGGCGEVVELVKMRVRACSYSLPPSPSLTEAAALHTRTSIRSPRAPSLVL